MYKIGVGFEITFTVTLILCFNFIMYKYEIFLELLYNILFHICMYILTDVSY